MATRFKVGNSKCDIYEDQTEDLNIFYNGTQNTFFSVSSLFYDGGKKKTKIFFDVYCIEQDTD